MQPQEERPSATDPGQRNRLGKTLAILGAVGSVVFLLNFSMGVFPEIPDNLPVVGNIDEAAATALLVYCLRYLGWDVLRGWRR